MKRLSTKSIGSLLKATASMVESAGRRVGERQFERMLQRHDRKGELRAGILGIDPLTFKELQRHHSFNEIMKLHGFASQQQFRVALLGKLRDELLRRGWSRRKIDAYSTFEPLLT